MKSVPFSKFRNFILIISLLILTGGIGYRMGESHSLGGSSQSVINTDTPKTTGIDFSLFWDVWNRVHRYYIDAPHIDNQKLVWGAISGMVNAIGDPYTSFFSPSENKEFKSDMSGEFQGIGAELGVKDSRIIVVSPLKGSPAEAAGIKSNDWIYKVNNEETLTWTVSQAVSKIRGPKGTKVTLSIVHDKASKPIDISITRDTINVPAIDSWVKPPGDIKEISGITKTGINFNSTKNIAYIRLSRFGDKLESEWSSAVNEVVNAQKNSNVAGLIFDLRGNPGGYLDGSVYVGSEFINSGTVVSQENSDGTKEDYKVNGKGKLYTIPVVVLINKGSASAAEIVAGALKDHKRATIVGETSFGKGSVQTPQELQGGASLHVTTGKWLTPNGTWISKKGITPDVEVTFDENITADEIATRDAQLAKAVEILLNK